MADPNPPPTPQFEHEFDPERDPIAARLARVAADDAVARSCMDDWRFHRVSRSEALIRAVELLAARCGVFERTGGGGGLRTPARQRHVLDEDDEA